MGWLVFVVGKGLCCGITVGTMDGGDGVGTDGVGGAWMVTAGTAGVVLGTQTWGLGLGTKTARQLATVRPL